MKIVFICGSLETGKDGVGDYVSQLGNEILKYDCEVMIVGFNDEFVNQLLSDSRRGNDKFIKIIRIPAILTRGERLKIAKKQIESFNPDWISIQFVPYSFNRNGLPFSFPLLMRQLGDYRWHIMFHELWLDKPKNISQTLIAFLQKRIIKRLVSVVTPNIVHASIAFNKDRLKQIGIHPKVLELFGNIPNDSKANADTSFIPHIADNKLLYFGSAPTGSYLNMVIQGIKDFCIQTGKSLHIFIIARESESKQIFKEKLNSILSVYDGTITDFGFLEAQVLSTVINNSTAGIGRSEAYLLGKSGSAIAMLEHGLPIWLPKWKNGEKLDFLFREELVCSNLGKALSTAHQGYHSKLPAIAKQFLYELNNS